jgi:hypothetical protein
MDGRATRRLIVEEEKRTEEILVGLKDVLSKLRETSDRNTELLNRNTEILDRIATKIVSS